MRENEREIAKVMLEEILENDNIGERAKMWILQRIEEYVWHQYQFREREAIEYIVYIQKMANTKAIQQKKEWLVQDLCRTRDSLLKKAAKQRKIMVKAGTKDNPTRQEAALSISDLQFSSLLEEIAFGEQVWDSVVLPEIEIQKPLEF